jgi:hypothetical protein
MMNKLFKNVLFSATVAVNHGTDQQTSGNATATSDEKEEDKVSYNDLKRMIEEMGGKVCATVHKKVDYLVASKCAVDGATQRVRKADKFNVPVVKIAFIQDVYKKTITPDAVGSYTFTSENITDSIEAYKNSSITSAGSSKVDTVPSESDHVKKDKKTGGGKKRKLVESAPPPVASSSSYKTPSFVSNETFNCACICHDRGETSCSWCVSVHIPSDTSTSTSSTCDAGDDIKNDRDTTSKSSGDCDVVTSVKGAPVDSASLDKSSKKHKTVSDKAKKKKKNKQTEEL